MTTVGTIHEIRRYPVKSMQGELLDHVNLTPLGIEGDRAYAVRDLTTRKILSAKAPKVGTLLLSCHARSEGGSVVITVNGNEFNADDARLNAALSTLLGREVALERAAGEDDVYESYWPEMDGMALSDVTVDLPIAMSTTKGTFTDLAALHLVADCSVEHLQSLNADLNLDLNRFRPSIAIATAGFKGFVEKQWVSKQAKLGGASIAFGQESPRCIMTTLAQRDLPRQPAVLQTIAKANRADFGGFGNFACLGVYAEVEAPGSIAVGDLLRLDANP